MRSERVEETLTVLTCREAREEAQQLRVAARFTVYRTRQLRAQARALYDAPSKEPKRA